MEYEITIRDIAKDIHITRTYHWEEHQTTDPNFLGERVMDMIEGINEVATDAERISKTIN